MCQARALDCLTAVGSGTLVGPKTTTEIDALRLLGYQTVSSAILVCGVAVAKFPTKLKRMWFRSRCTVGSHYLAILFHSSSVGCRSGLAFLHLLTHSAQQTSACLVLSVAPSGQQARCWSLN